MIPDAGDAARQVFRGDETRLFWRRLPGRTGPSAAEKPDPELAGARDLLTLLLSSNAAEGFKLKPLLVFLAENPRALRGFSKPNLPALWHSHRVPGSPGASSRSGSGASAPQWRSTAPGTRPRSKNCSSWTALSAAPGTWTTSPTTCP